MATPELPAPHRSDAKAAAAKPPRGQEAGALPRIVSSDALLADASQLAILHHQTIYFLRLTRFGKLILTK